MYQNTATANDKNISFFLRKIGKLSNQKQITAISNIKSFILAGNAIFTLRNTNADTRLTFKFSEPNDSNKQKKVPVFASVLTGNDNVNDYKFVGTIWQNQQLNYRHSIKSSITPNAKSAKTIEWLINHVNDNRELPTFVEFWHEGKCGKCGRSLTDPISIDIGLGPICRNK